MRSSLITIICVSIILERQVSGQAIKRPTYVRIQNRGYSSETHNITTKDGYILSIFRIIVKNKLPNTNRDSQSQRPVVLMMHGLISSSDCWVTGEPDKVLAFYLADNGYDVWLGNARGNPYSKRHLYMKPGERRFWRFSWHEIGVIDLPATIDYILKVTHETSLHYIGHSQGTSVLFVLLSTQPKYNNMIKSSHLLAPVAYMANARSLLLHLWKPIHGRYSPLDSILGDVPFLQQPLLKRVLGFDMCRNPTANRRFCATILFAIGGGVSAYLNQSLIPEIFDTHPASCSTHQGIHLVQLSVSGHFRQYDFGVSGNLKRYGRSTPPDYELENIKPRFPLHLYYSDYDELSAKKDVEKFIKLMGNKTVKHFIDLKQFSHIDFLYASNAREVLYEGMLERMEEVERNVTQVE